MKIITPVLKRIKVLFCNHRYKVSSHGGISSHIYVTSTCIKCGKIHTATIVIME